MTASNCKTIFISDLHLNEHQTELTDLFINFIENLSSTTTSNIDELYILGDFFNYWIGNDNYQPWHNRIVKALNQLSESTKIYFLAGNRDFLVDNHAANKFNFKLITNDHVNLNVYGNVITVLHGDTLCTKDTSYQKYRKIVRNKLFAFIYGLLPLGFRLKLVNKIKQKSKNTNQNYQDNPEIFDVCEHAVEKLFKLMDSKIIIHGHTHKPNVHKYHYDNNNSEYTRYVLGDWHKEGAFYLEMTKSSDKDPINFNLKYLKPL